MPRSVIVTALARRECASAFRLTPARDKNGRSTNDVNRNSAAVAAGESNQKPGSVTSRPEVQPGQPHALDVAKATTARVVATRCVQATATALKWSCNHQSEASTSPSPDYTTMLLDAGDQNLSSCGRAKADSMPVRSRASAEGSRGYLGSMTRSTKPVSTSPRRKCSLSMI